jgi:hypothetical protein
MKQYVRLFEYGVADFTQQTAGDVIRGVAGEAERERVFYKHKFLSQDLGRAIGVKIWKEWKMPFGWDEDKTSRIYWANLIGFRHSRDEAVKDEYFGNLMQIVKEMLAINPEMAVEPGYGKYMTHVMMGMFSRFNPDDIGFFMKFIVNDEMPAATAKKDPQYARAEKDINAMLGELFPHERLHVEWVASPRTMRIIYDRLSELKKQND